MQCPTCKGERTVMAFVDGRDRKTGRRWGGIRRIECDTCHGTGEIADEYPAWCERGAAVKAARMDPYMSMRDAAPLCRIGLVEYSAMERGVMDPAPIEPLIERQRQRREEA